jgi:hypothetical protein
MDRQIEGLRHMPIVEINRNYVESNQHDGVLNEAEEAI